MIEDLMSSSNLYDNMLFTMTSMLNLSCLKSPNL